MDLGWNGGGLFHRSRRFAFRRRSRVLFHPPDLQTESNTSWLLPAIHDGESRAVSMSGVWRPKLLSAAGVGLGNRLSRGRLQTDGCDPSFNWTARLSEPQLHSDHGSAVVHFPIRLHRRTWPDGLHSAGSGAPSRVSLARWVSAFRRFLGIGSKGQCRDRTQEGVSRIFDEAAAPDTPDFS